jgi:hypothetical protein
MCRHCGSPPETLLSRRHSGLDPESSAFSRIPDGSNQTPKRKIALHDCAFAEPFLQKIQHIDKIVKRGCCEEGDSDERGFADT